MSSPTNTHAVEPTQATIANDAEALVPSHDEPTLPLKGRFASLHVTVYRPTPSLSYYWSLSIFNETDDSWLTYEARREEPEDKSELIVRKGNPAQTVGFLQVGFIMVARIPATSADEVDGICRSVKILSMRDGLHCSQHYVRRALYSLLDASIIDEDQCKGTVARLDNLEAHGAQEQQEDQQEEEAVSSPEHVE
ncbi:hypothetical protein FZEAL_2381 [Fusarium zealandicum]|uniref:Uncharacterized protein n=1 Tax=Fusarium zealandicum TaxID=1053134 RepID=A0A8H4XNI2_9HYPO|nr:hypothetical protein FZEAL_2381 [Fusarium zealandicum]